jgi:hypothetical protein
MSVEVADIRVVDVLREIRDELRSLNETARTRPRLMLVNFKGDITARDFEEFVHRFNEFIATEFPDES